MKCGIVRVDLIMFCFTDDEEDVEGSVETLATIIKGEAKLQQVMNLRTDDW